MSHNKHVVNVSTAVTAPHSPAQQRPKQHSSFMHPVSIAIASHFSLLAISSQSGGEIPLAVAWHSQLTAVFLKHIEHADAIYCVSMNLHVSGLSVFSAGTDEAQVLKKLGPRTMFYFFLSFKISHPFHKGNDSTSLNLTPPPPLPRIAVEQKILKAAQKHKFAEDSPQVLATWTVRSIGYVPAVDTSP